MGTMEGRTVLVTGASRGLGEALARAFAAEGARVSICARGAGVQRVAASIRDSGGVCIGRSVDVTSEAEVGLWVEETTHELGGPDVLVNNASVLGPRVPLADHPLDAWRATLEVNLTGAFVATRAVLPAMLAAGRGSIVNVSSGAAVPPRVDWGAYAVSKHALEGFSLNLARELEGTGVRVNVVDPGSMRTGMRAAAYPAEDPDRLPPPDAKVDVFLWLAGDASAGVTGRRFRADEWSGAPG